MPALTVWPKVAIALLPLALAACDRAPPPSQNTSAAPDPSTMSAPEPPMDQGQAAPPSEPAPAPAQGGGPRERFVVCPGNPRCPPAGSRPKGQSD